VRAVKNQPTIRYGSLCFDPSFRHPASPFGAFLPVYIRKRLVFHPLIPDKNYLSSHIYSPSNCYFPLKFGLFPERIALAGPQTAAYTFEEALISAPVKTNKTPCTQICDENDP
jgi:hypothetical protein